MKRCVLLYTHDDVLANRVSAALPEYMVACCRTKEEAVALCDRYLICLALVSHTPPHIDAGEVFGWLREHNPGLAGILLATHFDLSLLKTVQDANLSSVLELPLEDEQLHKAVQFHFDRVELQDENSRLRTLLPLYSLGEQFLSSTTEEEILNGMLGTVSDLTGASHISVFLYDELCSCLRVAASKGLDSSLASSIQIRPGESISGWVFQHGKPVILNKEDQDETIFASFLQRPEIVSSISCPMSIRDKIIGVLNISLTSTDSRFSEADKEMLSVVCTQASLALENVRALQKMSRSVRMQTLLEQYVAPEVAELLLSQETDPMELGRIEQVTIFFADIRSFTSLVQRLSLTDLRAFLNDFFDIFTEIIFKKQGTVDKFMGDAVLAFFGAPMASDNANFAAVEAALLIRQRFAELREHWVQENSVFANLDLGIGVTCGQVFLGNVGSNKRFDYTVIGNEVNIAQRLAAESAQCSIFVTESVKEALADQFNFIQGGAVHLRGITDPVTVFTLPV